MVKNLQYSRVSTDNQPLASQPEDAGNEIETEAECKLLEDLYNSFLENDLLFTF